MMPGQHGTSLKDYTQALTVQLRLRDVPGRAIGQIVAEVESHVRETGEDPVQAFGQPGTYSAQFAGGRGRGGRLWPALRIWSTIAVGVGGWMLLEGMFNLAGVVRVTGGMILAWAAVVLMFAFVVHRVDVVMADRDTRTVSVGHRAKGSHGAHWLHLLALFATLRVGMAIRSWSPEAPIIIQLPGGILLLAGLALSAVSLWVYVSRSDRIVDPRDPR